MIRLENKTLRSKRLTYRLLNDADKAALQEILSDRSVTEPAGFMPADSKEEFDTFFAGLTGHNAGIAILSGEKLIGYIRVEKYTPDLTEYRERNCVSTGFVIGKKYQNQGFATETLESITAYLKQMFDYCFADCFEDNTPSKKVIEKCGYRYVEKYTLFFDVLGKEITCLSYVY